MRGERGDFLADAGAVVGGATALGAALGVIAGSVFHDFRAATDRDASARRDGYVGGVGGVVIFLTERWHRLMSVRTRKHAAAAAVALLAVGLTRVAHALDWSKAEMYVVGAGMLVAFCLVALPWIEMAPDGAWRRPDG